jgi:DNA topoisomerase-1
LIKSFDEDKDLQVLNGRFGPYISLGKKNFKIPKDLKPEELSFEKCMEIIEATPDKPAGAKRKFVPKGKNSKK